MKSRLNETFEAVEQELKKATEKFPQWPDQGLHALAILGEEFGELNKAMLQMTYEPNLVTPEHVKKEAIQTAAMAIRLIMSLPEYEYRKCSQHYQGV